MKNFVSALYKKTYDKLTLVLGAKERNLSIRINRNDNIREIIKRSEKTLEEIDNAIEHADRNYFVVEYGTSRRINRDNSNGNAVQGRAGTNRYSNISTYITGKEGSFKYETA